ncbi:MAG: multidrug efflux RND transporter permease subunit [Alphaproteobacteria bacterium]|nr:multidrug efflux RND transporter permease subunit [Alphaproteobacteria bacterium]
MITFLIDRPVFSSVVSILILLMGAVAMQLLPIARFPPIAPPQVEVQANFVGAGAQAVEDAVTEPLEEAINGVDGMIYLSSSSTSDGVSTVRVTFEVGYDVDIAAVDVLNRVNQAEPLLPQTVQDLGVTVRKTSPQLTAVVSLYSPNGTYDQVFLSNYADIHILDPLNRIPGVGSLVNFGQRNYAIRIWLDPQRLAFLNLTPEDVVAAVRAENVEVAAGQIGQPPLADPRAFQFQVSAAGRLETAEQFADIIVRSEADGGLVRLRDLGRVELGASSYASSAYLAGQPSAQLGVFQASDANALALIAEIRATMERLSGAFPDDLAYRVTFDTAGFVQESVNEVVITLFLAAALVGLVMFVFLQSWRTTLIPLIAIPVSLVGAFAFLFAFGFSINTLTLLGMVLAVGLVVDDAIVVVENVERNLQKVGDARQAAKQAMAEVTGPIIATTLVLFALFLPIAFLPGITGQLYRQFSLTIAMAVGLSSIVSLSLTPSLCGVLLKAGARQPGWAFRQFNSGFRWLAERLRGAVQALARAWPLALLLFAGVVAAAVFLLLTRPGGFVPQEDQGYLFVNVELPAASSLDRTEAVVLEMQDILLDLEGVADVVGVAGFSLVSQTNAPYVGLGVAILEPWSERQRPDLSARALIGQAQQRLGAIRAADIQVINPPSIPGIGSVGGLQLEVEDRGGAGIAALAEAAQGLIGAGLQRPEFALLFTTFNADIPQIGLDVDRDRVRRATVPFSRLYTALQAYLGSVFVNEFNRFGQTYRVFVQAEAEARDDIADISRLHVVNAEGRRVPLDRLVSTRLEAGTDNIPHYNLYPSAAVRAVPAPGVSGGEAVAAMEELAAETLPPGFAFEWTGSVFQEQQAGNLAPIVFGLALLFVFLVLAAQYESLAIPFVIILSVPFAMLGALGFLTLRGLDLDVFAQIGLVMLIGLAAKNAILIAAFAKDRRQSGAGIVEAATDAAAIRMRPVMMTALSFIFGTLPLVLAGGAGANARISVGTTVVGGMTAAMVLTLLMVPVFYILVETARERLSRRRRQESESGPGRLADRSGSEGRA